MGKRKLFVHCAKHTHTLYTHANTHTSLHAKPILQTQTGSALQSVTLSLLSSYTFCRLWLCSTSTSRLLFRSTTQWWKTSHRLDHRDGFTSRLFAVHVSASICVRDVRYDDPKWAFPRVSPLSSILNLKMSSLSFHIFLRATILRKWNWIEVKPMFITTARDVFHHWLLEKRSCFFLLQRRWFLLSIKLIRSTFPPRAKNTSSNTHRKSIFPQIPFPKATWQSHKSHVHTSSLISRDAVRWLELGVVCGMTSTN